MSAFLNRRCLNRELSKCVAPRRSYRPRTVHPADINGVLEAVSDCDTLAATLKDLGEQAGVPVLLRQCPKLGGQIATTNVDPQFSGVLDALVVLYLRKTEPRLVDRYMGKDRAASFRRFHATA